MERIAGTVRTRYKTPVATRARSLYATGLSIRQVCARLDEEYVPAPHYNTVYRWLTAVKATRTKHEAAMVRCGNRERYVLAIMLRIQHGLATAEIARRLAWNAHTVRRVLRDAGVSHTQGEGRKAAWAASRERMAA